MLQVEDLLAAGSSTLERGGAGDAEVAEVVPDTDLADLAGDGVPLEVGLDGHRVLESRDDLSTRRDHLIPHSSLLAEELAGREGRA